MWLYLAVDEEREMTLHVLVSFVVVVVVVLQVRKQRILVRRFWSS